MTKKKRPEIVTATAPTAWLATVRTSDHLPVTGDGAKITWRVLPAFCRDDCLRFYRSACAEGCVATAALWLGYLLFGQPEAKRKTPLAGKDRISFYVEETPAPWEAALKVAREKTSVKPLTRPSLLDDLTYMEAA